MPDPQEPKHPQLDLPTLRNLESQFCRARRRPEWWTRDSQHPAEGLGRIIESLREYRMDLRIDTPSMSQATLRELVKIDPKEFSDGSFNQFLHGDQHSDEWVVRGKRALNFILNGTVRPSEDEPQSDESQLVDETRNEVARRIIGFYFPDEVATLLEEFRNPPERQEELWLLSPTLRGIRKPATRLEFEAELRALEIDASEASGLGFQVVRVSGRRRFPVVKSDLVTLESRGKLTVKCLKHEKFQAVFVYPKAPSRELRTRAELSALKFRELAIQEIGKKCKDQIRLIELDPGQCKVSNDKPRWAAEYLAPYIRWTLYQRPDGDNYNPRNLVVPTRPYDNSRLDFSSGEDQDADFLAWFEMFC